MSGRPCNPGSDLRQLWQALLGNTPFPQCDTPDKPDSSQKRDDAPDGEKTSEREQAAAGVQHRR